MSTELYGIKKKSSLGEYRESLLIKMINTIVDFIDNLDFYFDEYGFMIYTIALLIITHLITILVICLS